MVIIPSTPLTTPVDLQTVSTTLNPIWLLVGKSRPLCELPITSICPLPLAPMVLSSDPKECTWAVWDYFGHDVLVDVQAGHRGKVAIFFFAELLSIRPSHPGVIPQEASVFYLFNLLPACRTCQLTVVFFFSFVSLNEEENEKGRDQT